MNARVERAMERITEIIDADGFRANVGMIVTRENGDVLWGRCLRNHGWQFPQGGIDIGETAEEALYRELYEEVGLGVDDIKVMGRTTGWLRYRLPLRYQRQHASPRCVGQKQVWFLLQLRGDETTIRLDAVDHPEFDRWCWVSWWQPLSDIIFFKRRVYERALIELAGFAFPDGAPVRYPRPNPAHESEHNNRRWCAPRSPYRIMRGGSRRGLQSQSKTGRESH